MRYATLMMFCVLAMPTVGCMVTPQGITPLLHTDLPPLVMPEQDGEILILRGGAERAPEHPFAQECCGVSAMEDGRLEV